MDLKQLQTPNKIQTKVKGSVTVEAALAFPVFLLSCLALCYLFVFIKVEYTVQREMYYAAKEISGLGPIIEPLAKYRNEMLSDTEMYIYKDGNKKTRSDIIQALTSLLPSGGNGISIKNLISNTADNLIFHQILENRLEDNVLKYFDNGSSGIDCEGSILYGIDKCMTIKCSYDLVLPMGIFPGVKIPVSHSIRYRYFTGTEVESLLVEVVPDEDTGEEPKEDEDEEEEEVLITDTGKCYHYSYSCPALNVRPSEVQLSEVGLKRNDGGGKYKPCEFCALNKVELPKCYITPDGDRYHFEKNCQGLKRTIMSVPISEVGKRRECKRCKNYKKK